MWFLIASRQLVPSETRAVMTAFQVAVDVSLELEGEGQERLKIEENFLDANAEYSGYRRRA